MRLIVPIVLIWGIAANLARLPAELASIAIAPDLAQPVPVVFGWRLAGVAFVALLAITAAVSARTVARSRETRGDGSRSIALSVAAACCAVAAWPAVLSSDVYAYAGFGANAAGGAHPAILRAAAWQWGRTLPPDNYGPLFDALAGAIVRLTGDHIGAALGAFRIAACAALTAGAVLLFALARGDRAERAACACAFGLNPIALWSAAEGHNDLIAIAAVLGALLLARRVPFAGGLLAALAALIKAPALIGAAAAAVLRRPPRAVFAWGLLGGAVIALGVSLPAIAAALARAGSGGEHTIPVLYPWYLTWLLPLFALSRAVRERALLLAPLAFATYLPDAFGTPSPALRLGLSVIVIAGFAPLALIALRQLYGQRKSGPVPEPLAFIRAVRD